MPLLSKKSELVNGDFETPPVGGFRDVSTAIPGWKTEGMVELVESGQRQGGMILIVPEGAHAARLGNDAEMSQGVKTEDSRVVFRNPGMEDDPSCGPIIDDIAIKKMFVPDKPKDNAVLNGDFEEGPWMFRNETLGVLLPTNFDHDTSSLPGWIVESNRAVRYVDSYHFKVPGGKRAIELLSGKEGIISQMVGTKPNKPYRLTFSLGHAGDACKQPLAVMAFAGDQARNIHYTPDSNSTFQTADLNFTARAERTRVAFYSIYYNTRTDDMSSLCGPVVDDVRVEQSGSVGFGLGVLGLLLILLCQLMVLV
ncbi:Protein of unknown function- DUF642 [Striga hermonthica]|uniref:DUF642 domain-containing protein n=1 Tax=Striga hermonthica TaxID=68872 RepID=A0A9N7NL33_STRHE|nr:Protein of unknown function- DUF642 [Striga hermonthica]